MKKILKSKTRIRFNDCDPFNHLNNSKYVDYFINAREDQILENYGIDLSQLAKEHKIGWVVSLNQIAFFYPAFPNELVSIDSQVISVDEKSLLIEMRMWNENETKLKSISWTRLVHYHIIQQISIPHSEEFQKLFQEITEPLEEKNFEERINSLKASYKAAKSKA